VIYSDWHHIKMRCGGTGIYGQEREGTSLPTPRNRSNAERSHRRTSFGTLSNGRSMTPRRQCVSSRSPTDPAWTAREWRRPIVGLRVGAKVSEPNLRSKSGQNGLVEAGQKLKSAGALRIGTPPNSSMVEGVALVQACRSGKRCLVLRTASPDLELRSLSIDFLEHRWDHPTMSWTAGSATTTSAPYADTLDTAQLTPHCDSRRRRLSSLCIRQTRVGRQHPPCPAR